MAIKSKHINKYYIKQYVITSGFQEWLLTNYDQITENDKIIGYLFAERESAFKSTADILNLYLIKKEYYAGDGVSEEELTKSWELFLSTVNTELDMTRRKVFKNPPIENWLDTKDNWCKKLANSLSNSYNIPYHEMLSDVYFGIMLCYTRGNIYMGSLNYIRRCVNNIVLMKLRALKHRVNQDSGLAVSMNTIIGKDNTEEDILLSDTIADKSDKSEESAEYNSVLNHCRKLLSDSFTDREIDQIISQRISYLPQNIQVKLLYWRKKHDISEVLSDGN